MRYVDCPTYQKGVSCARAFGPRPVVPGGIIGVGGVGDVGPLFRKSYRLFSRPFASERRRMLLQVVSQQYRRLVHPKTFSLTAVRGGTLRRF